ncbi:MAG TPA: hypothetical protein VKU89_04310 [Solirubrobacteraceae bacterium]|nr:hypothetical protein [Solirubrobacteraceae bacterium]
MSEAVTHTVPSLSCDQRRAAVGEELHAAIEGPATRRRDVLDR